MARPEITGRRAHVGAPDAALPPGAFSIATFCKAFDISESFFHKLQALGLGPKTMRAGRRVLISHEAAKRWAREREREAAHTA
jgi:hypothetical protein